MLDKSLPYKSFTMIMPPEKACAIEPPALPQGYAYRLYQPGDEHGWARLETSVAEFDAEEAALAYYAREYLPYPQQLAQRCVLITAPDGQVVGTATAWYAGEQPQRHGQLHWVAVSPAHQGLGLGRAVVQKALSIFPKLEPGRPIHLHTQTWSWKAVILYHSLGFCFCPVAHSPKEDPAGALALLRQVLPEKIYRALADSQL